MKTRSISAIGILLISIVPSILGGWFFALTVAIIFILAFRELLKLIGTTDGFTGLFGTGIIAFACVVAVIWPSGEGLPLVMVLLCLVPLTFVILPAYGPVDISDWAVRMGSAAYLALPAYGAVSMRETEGTTDATWLMNLVASMPGSRETAEGLGWFLFALLIAWMSDTFAYLVGKTVGRTKLIPRVSPNKTVEGALGGLAAAGITAALVVTWLGLPMHPGIAAVLGIVLGALGMLGDLFESQLKRRASVKDSGNAIPGHGGFLDRIDSLIWVLLASFAFVPFLT
jgi:phosphatidate cytidylyltransferase